MFPEPGIGLRLTAVITVDVYHPRVPTTCGAGAPKSGPALAHVVECKLKDVQWALAFTHFKSKERRTPTPLVQRIVEAYDMFLTAPGGSARKPRKNDPPRGQGAQRMSPEPMKTIEAGTCTSATGQ